MSEYDRARLSRIALEWQGTPYVHEGHIKQACADCTFFVDVYEEAGLIEHVTLPHYSAQAHLNRQAAMYVNVLQRFMHEIDKDQIGIADIVMFRIARTWSHGAMIIEPGWPHVIHADIMARMVLSAVADTGKLHEYEQRYFSFFWKQS